MLCTFPSIFILLFCFSVQRTVAQDTLSFTLRDSLDFVASMELWQQQAPVIDSLTDWQVASAMEVLQEKIAVVVAQRQWTLDSLRLQRAQYDSLLAVAKADTTLDKAGLKTYKNQQKTAVQQEKAGKKRLQSAQSALDFVQKNSALAPPDRRRQLPKSYQRYLQLLPPPPPVATPAPDTLAAVAAPVVAAVEDSTATTPPPAAVPAKKSAPEKNLVVKYDPKKDPVMTPPARPCLLAVVRKDAFTGAVYKETEPIELFRFTNPVMRKVLPDTQAHIRCYAALSKDVNGGQLHLRFDILDPNARRTFGGLSNNSFLSLKFMDGELVTLFNELNQEVQSDPATGVSGFRGRYAFQPAFLKKLGKKELDSIRVAWSTGYEDYSVYDVAGLRELVRCLGGD